MKVRNIEVSLSQFTIRMAHLGRQDSIIVSNSTFVYVVPWTFYLLLAMVWGISCSLRPTSEHLKVLRVLRVVLVATTKWQHFLVYARALKFGFKASAFVILGTTCLFLTVAAFILQKIIKRPFLRWY